MTDAGILKPLAARLLDLAGRAEEGAKKELWARHNALLPTGKIPVCVTFEGIPGKQWELMFGAGFVRCEGALARSIESDLRRRIWAAENIGDDHIVWPAVFVGAASSGGRDWGVELEWAGSGEELGARRVVAPFEDGIDLSKLRRPETAVDEEATALRLEEAAELTGGMLAVAPSYPGLGESPFETAVRMRGMERIFFDVYDAPELVHGMMEFITEATLADHLHRAERGWVNCAIDESGRYQMLARWRHLCAFAPPEEKRGAIAAEWPYVSAQSASGLGPEMYGEFVHRYNSRIAELFTRGNVYYHGCECLDAKLGVIGTLPNLRRHHVSPWSSVEKAAAHYAGRVVLEVHSHPGEVFFGWTKTEMRAELKRLVAEASGRPMSLNLSDIHSVNGEPATLGRWASIAQEVSRA